MYVQFCQPAVCFGPGYGSQRIFYVGFRGTGNIPVALSETPHTLPLPFYADLRVFEKMHWQMLHTH